MSNKVSLFNLTFPNSGSWPLTAPDWIIASAGNSFWKSADDIRLDSPINVARLESYQWATPLGAYSQWVRMKVINFTPVANSFGLKVFTNLTGLRGYEFVVSAAFPGTYDITRDGVSVASGTFNTFHGDEIEVQGITDKLAVSVTINIYVNDALVLTYTDNSPDPAIVLNSAPSFSFDAGADVTGPSFIEIGSVSGGYFDRGRNIDLKGISIAVNAKELEIEKE